MKVKKLKPLNKNDAVECSRMTRCIRHTLANNFPETSQDIALLVLLRLSVTIAVDAMGKERAPAALSRLINCFLLMDHHDR